MIEVLLLEHRSEDAEFISRILQQINSDVHVEWMRDSRLVTDFIFATGQYATREPECLPNVILLDMTNPKTSLELLRTIKAYVRTRVVPVVVLISEGSDPSMFRGADLCIEKASDREEFARAVELMGRYWLSNNPIGLSQIQQIGHNQPNSALSADNSPEISTDQPSTLMDEAGTAFAS
jgi:two-component system, response regulator